MSWRQWPAIPGWRGRVMTAWRFVAAATVLATLVVAIRSVACTPAPAGPRAGVIALLDGSAAPDVLVEARVLAAPPATAGNRFLTGWTVEKKGDLRLLQADPRGARLEAVHLGTAPRRLVLALAPPLLNGAMEVSIAGRAPLRVPCAERVEVPLPTDLPHGRFVVDLRFPDGLSADGAPLLRGAGFDSWQPAGEVRIAAGELRQGGVSRVELVRPLAGAATLVGELAPPAGARKSQRFEIRARSSGGERVLWSWRPRWWQRGAQRLRVPVRGEGGWLRLALVATTPGPPARWRDLGLETAASQEAGGTPVQRENETAGDERDADDDGAAARAGAGEPVAGGTTGVNRAPSSTADAAPTPPKLVVLYVFDALRADAVGARDPHGSSATPTLDRLGAEGARFASHFSVAPNTLPSTKALLTGHVWRQRGGVTLGATPATLAERFRAAGWRTGLFSGNVYVSRAFGVDRGFETAPESTLFGPDAEQARPFNDNAAAVNHAALEWLRALPPSARAFLYLHVVHPHNPYDPPPELRARFDDSRGATVDGSSSTLLDIEQRRLVATEADRQRLRALYHASLAYADGELAKLLAALRERYAPEEMLFALTADHGEELFEHGGVLHGYTLYDEMLHIPLLLWSPGRVPVRTVTRLTDSLGLHHALGALAGGGSNGAQSLWTVLSEPVPTTAARDPEREIRFAAASALRGGIFAARTTRWKVVWAPRTGPQWGMGQGAGRSREPEYVFDLTADPGERRNLAGIDEPEVQWLRARLLAWAARTDADEGGDGAQDAETRARLKALGYVD